MLKKISLTLRIAACLLCTQAILPIQARAQESAAPAAASVSYTVSIDGAGELTSLLKDNLEISRRQSAGGLAEDEIRRLAGSAPNQIRTLLATEGYFSPSVTHELDQRGETWTAHYKVALGPRTLVDTVDIRIKGDVAASNPQRVERLQRRWSLPAGNAFRQKDWDDAKNNLLKSLLVRDYPAAAITQSEARIDPATNSAALTVEVDSGPAFTFGELEISGLQRYASRIVTDLNPIKPGEPYSQEKLNELQARVQDTGYFRSAFATVNIDPAHPKNVPIKLELNENERKRLSLGIGFSTDSGPRGQIRWLDRNFLQRDWRLESRLLVDRNNRLLGADVFLPPLQNDWRPSFGTRYEYTNSEGELNDKTATAARLTSPDKNNEMVWATTLYTDHQRIEGSDYSNHREAVIGSFTYTRRSLNNLISPSRGYVASIDLGAGPTGDGKTLARVVGRATYLSPYYKRWQAVLRGEVGQVSGAGRESVPADLLFRTGGDQTVRGYGYNTLGVEQDGAIVGGTNSAVFSAELVYRITPQWGAAVFHDTGNAADSWKGFHFAHGSGVGARWRSPIGPVNLDLAYGHDTHEVRLHFSVGYGF
ncbi:autotransporter assembly complex protein TamA [Oxalicibacterium solurbis]|uniref:Translocation and assembly module subunit TamA n=1 Tax=Oxalicibacterium solurbis TaxID=69280 RepID=A0A8J3F602_9BURK|nr:autotransporter assembly complex family protein [Oxalicibacterium solurbis]GGI54238.1 outer membrane protein assembly factor [Oxalicibacterium solurbis]